MKLILRTLQQENFTVEIDPSQTVKCFKEEIEKLKGSAFPAKDIKLVFGGKYLTDESRVGDYGLDEKKFVIVFMKQPKKQLGRQDAESDSHLSSSEREHEQYLRFQNEHMIPRLVDLGFSRDQVERALAASNNNPDAAVDYLVNDMFSTPPAWTSYHDLPRFRNPEDEMDSATIFPNMFQIDVPLSISDVPSEERMFEVFSESVADCENRSRLQDRFMEAEGDIIAQSYQDLVGAGVFDSIAPMLNGYDDSANDPLRVAGTITPENMVQALNAAFNGPEGIGMASCLSDRDHEAIERLQQLGFSDHRVIEAFYMCGKDESAAIEYLLATCYK